MPELRSPRVWLAIAWSTFQLYTAYAGLYDLLIQLPVHVAFAVALGFLTEPTPDSLEAAARLAARRPRRLLDSALALLALLCAAHFVWHNERLATRMAMVDDPERLDVAVGVLWLISLLVLSLRGNMSKADALDVEIAGLYWHFVDIVWIIIFTVVYLIT